MRTRILILALVAAAAAACYKSSSPLEVTGTQSRTFTANRGTEIHITLSTVGPGNYASPPTITGPSVTFIDVATVCPCNPGGPTQLFRFKAVSSGASILHFTHTASGPAVEDTVVVQ